MTPPTRTRSPPSPAPMSASRSARGERSPSIACKGRPMWRFCWPASPRSANGGCSARRPCRSSSTRCCLITPRQRSLLSRDASRGCASPRSTAPRSSANWSAARPPDTSRCSPRNGARPIGHRYVRNSLIAETRWPGLQVVDYLDTTTPGLPDAPRPGARVARSPPKSSSHRDRTSDTPRPPCRPPPTGSRWWRRVRR